MADAFLKQTIQRHMEWNAKPHTAPACPTPNKTDPRVSDVDEAPRS